MSGLPAAERPTGAPTEQQVAAIRASYDTGVTVLHSRTEIGTLLAAIDVLVAELDGRDEEASERWIAKTLAETGIKAMDFRNGMSMELEPAREMVAHWVGAARGMLGDAENYSETPIEMTVKVAESPETFAFTLQRVGKVTPHQARRRAEQQRDEALAILQRVREARRLGEALAAVAEYDRAREQLAGEGGAQ